MPSYVTTVTLPATPTGGVLVDAGATEVTSMLSVVDQAAADAAVTAHAVRFDAAQTLTSGQATQARANMGLGSIATADAGSYESGAVTTVYVGGASASDANAGLLRSRPKATLAGAVAALGAGSGVIKIAPYAVLAETTSIDIDCSKIQIRGYKSTVNWAAMPAAGYCIMFHKNGLVDSVTCDGVWFGSSAGKLAGPCFKMGDGVNNTSDLCIRNGNVSNYTVGLDFRSDTYRITFDRFDLINVGVTVSATGNFGECMVWKDSLLEAPDDNTPLHFARGGWNFQNCKLDEAPILADTQFANLQFDQCHFENPLLGNYTYINASNGAIVHINSGRVVVDQPSGGFTANLFNSDATNSGFAGSGIFIHEQVALIGYTGYNAPTGKSALIGGTGPGYWVDSSWVAIGAAGAPAFINSWANVGGAFFPAAYKMTENGIVRVRGAVTGGGAATAAFTLPTRYRPADQMGFALMDTATFVARFAQVLAGGSVSPMSANAVDLSPIAFSVI